MSLHARLPVGWMGTPDHFPTDISALLGRHGFLLQTLRPEDAHSVPLVLLDCRHFPADALRQFFNGMPPHDRHPVFALHHASPGGTHEQLVCWPVVRGIFYDNDTPARLPQALRAMLAGENWFPRHLMSEWMNQQRLLMPPPMPSSETPGLTLRERQILHHINQAHTNAQIAYALAISEHTVKTHLYNIFRKIAVRNRTQACNWAKANLPLMINTIDRVPPQP